MRLSAGFRSLRAHYYRWVLLPLSLAMAAITLAGILAYQQMAATPAADREMVTVALFGAVGVGTAVVVLLLTWGALRRITTPVNSLAQQTRRLARGEDIEPLSPTGIEEFDALQRSFSDMAGQITTYRAGLRRYAGAITQSQEEERQHIARELHDETVQNLLAIARRLELYETVKGNLDLGDLQDLIDSVVRGVRRISRDLRPPVLEELGLIPALQNLIESSTPEGAGALHASLETAGQPVPLTPDVELALYRITQEALNNVWKHARAVQVCVTLAFEPGAVNLEVRDDGMGFDVPASLAVLAQSGSFGLMGIQERVWAVGGVLALESAQGAGTAMRVTIPLRLQAAPVQSWPIAGADAQ